MSMDTPRRSPGTAKLVATAAAGAAVAAACFMAAGGVESPAAGQEPSAGANFTLSVAQLRINQRISSAAVRRSNESLQLLDPIRPLTNQPDKVLGWGTTNLRDGAVTGSKIGDGAVTGSKIGEGAVGPEKLSNPTFSAVVGAGGQLDRGTGVVSSSLVGPPAGQYHVLFSRDVTACAYTVSQGGISNVVSRGFASATRLEGQPTGVRVRTWTVAAVETPQNRAFHLIVQC
jgi:hypothetical protein